MTDRLFGAEVQHSSAAPPRAQLSLPEGTPSCHAHTAALARGEGSCTLRCAQKRRFFGSRRQQLARRQINEPIHQQLVNDLHTHAAQRHHQAPKTLERFARLYSAPPYPLRIRILAVKPMSRCGSMTPSQKQPEAPSAAPGYQIYQVVLLDAAQVPPHAPRNLPSYFVSHCTLK